MILVACVPNATLVWYTLQVFTLVGVWETGYILRLPAKEHLRKWTVSFISLCCFYQQDQTLQLRNKLWYGKKNEQVVTATVQIQGIAATHERETKCKSQQSALQGNIHNAVTFWKVAQSCISSNTAAERWWLGMTCILSESILLQPLLKTTTRSSFLILVK